ncbi:MAG: serpin family protein [Deltaproteobacteria bacterium]|nr:serpin family protein [Deltaproteobacteria bacterium]
MVKARAAALTIAISGAAASAGCAEPKAPPSTEGAHPDAATTVGSVAEPAPSQAARPVTASPDEARGRESTTVDAAAPAAPSAREADDFTLRLFGALRKTPGNLLFSGTSLRTALGVTYLGARGETAREMAGALSFPADAAAAAASAKEEGAAWEAAKGKAQLVVASRAWIEKTMNVDARYAALAEDAYGASPAPLDFLSKPEDGRRAINAWVASKTAEKIVDLVPSGAIDKSTRLVVTNAIYFKGRWALPFEASATKDEPFESAPSKKTNVKTMHTTDTFAFTETPDVKLVELRYEGSELAMTIVLPKDRAGLAKVEEKLDVATLEAWRKSLTRRRVALSLPRFTFRNGGSMTAPLRAMGMRAAFTRGADFSGITTEKIEIGEVLQKTFIAVDENGTEAAAASGVIMRTTSMPMGEVAELKADHPFLFFVHDVKKGAIVFAGRVTEPK